jgi:hypothetical protein
MQQLRNGFGIAVAVQPFGTRHSLLLQRRHNNNQPMAYQSFNSGIAHEIQEEIRERQERDEAAYRQGLADVIAEEGYRPSGQITYMPGPTMHPQGNSNTVIPENERTNAHWLHVSRQRQETMAARLLRHAGNIRGGSPHNSPLQTLPYAAAVPMATINNDPTATGMPPALPSPSPVQLPLPPPRPFGPNDMAPMLQMVAQAAQASRPKTTKSNYNSSVAEFKCYCDLLYNGDYVVTDIKFYDFMWYQAHREARNKRKRGEQAPQVVFDLEDYRDIYNKYNCMFIDAQASATTSADDDACFNYIPHKCNGVRSLDGYSSALYNLHAVQLTQNLTTTPWNHIRNKRFTDLRQWVQRRQKVKDKANYKEK